MLKYGYKNCDEDSSIGEMVEASRGRCEPDTE